ncbi:MAG: cyclic nucleotide-binding domain-containing protein [Gammaproteobacteria bacterium]|nr:cyclic nucleotide-binding domain-containing protein [Gammaproteobacteria bacterium]
MPPRYQIVIVGSGPAGLSAAARAAELDRANSSTTPSYVLLESHSAHAKTIQRYQVGKHVMAEPGYLTLRSDCEFQAGTREAVLDQWRADLDQGQVNVQFDAEVTSISGNKGAFSLALKSGDEIEAENIVLAIGLEGSPRKIGTPGENLPLVQYHLEDPKAFRDEVIVVIGAGDSAIENVLGLAASKNHVYIINRREEFSRAKEGNLALILAAISDSSMAVDCLYSSNVNSVIETPEADEPLAISLNTPEGEVTIACHRVIARLGGVPPRRFVEGAGVSFPNERPDAIPELSRTYETDVSGIYIIGSLAGYPLIKQAMNQGYDVVEYINGNDVEPADYPLLHNQFHCLPFEREPRDVLDLFQRRIPFFSRLNALTFRELIMESNVVVTYREGELFNAAVQQCEALDATLADLPQTPRSAKVIAAGEYLYREGEYASSFFTIVEGEVVLETRGQADVQLSRGRFFGEGSLISGRPRQESARAEGTCILVETPRRIMVKLFNSNEDVRQGVDWIFIVRELKRHFAPDATFDELREVSSQVVLKSYNAGEVLFEAGDVGNSLHIVRRGSVSLQRGVGDQAATVVELRSGQLVGEMALMGDANRRERAIATVATETIELKRAEFLTLMRLNAGNLDGLQNLVSNKLVKTTQMETRPESGGVLDFLLAEGLGEATDTLIIDEQLCIGCDNCERACAETHNGLSRLDRAAGKSFANIHVPIACRHCEHPHCMKDCPPDAIHRATDGQVFIDDTCIGCGNCQVNCPYDVIRMSYPAAEKPSLLRWMLFGQGPGPGEPDAYDAMLLKAGGKSDQEAQQKGKRAVKCDACVNEASGPACVRACPTGAARRINPEQFIELLG